MKFQASSLVILVMSTLLTNKISSPTFRMPFLSAAPPNESWSKKFYTKTGDVDELPVNIFLMVMGLSP